MASFLNLTHLQPIQYLQIEVALQCVFKINFTLQTRLVVQSIPCHMMVH